MSRSTCPLHWRFGLAFCCQICTRPLSYLMHLTWFRLTLVVATGRCWLDKRVPNPIGWCQPGREAMQDLTLNLVEWLATGNT